MLVLCVAQWVHCLAPYIHFVVSLFFLKKKGYSCCWLFLSLVVSVANCSCCVLVTLPFLRSDSCKVQTHQELVAVVKTDDPSKESPFSKRIGTCIECLSQTMANKVWRGGSSTSWHYGTPKSSNYNVNSRSHGNDKDDGTTEVRGWWENTKRMRRWGNNKGRRTTISSWFPCRNKQNSNN